MNYTKNRKTSALADQMIGAAQILERQARDLKLAARIIRESGLMTWDYDPIVNQIQHKTANIKTSATAALHALGGLDASDWLVETDHRDFRS